MLHGRAAIGRFYEDFLATITPRIRIFSYVEQAHECVYEIGGTCRRLPEFRLSAIDHATFDSRGQVVRFAVFTK